MNTPFYDMMFNPQYVNANYYQAQKPWQYQMEQDKKVCDAVKAIHDLCEAVKGMDAQHQQLAFNACLAEIAKEQNW